MFDCIIVGGGPAGFSAGLFAKRLGLNCLLLESSEMPAQIAYATSVEDYPGFENITGAGLLEKMKKQAKIQGLKTVAEAVKSIKKSKNYFLVITDKKNYETKTIIIATGATHRRANIKGEADFIGRGVSYCATCDGQFFKGKSAVVLGSGDAALTYAIYLRGIGCEVTVLYKKHIKAAKAYEEKAKKLGVKFAAGIAEEIMGKKSVEKIIVNGKEIKCSAVFIAIGEIPMVDIVKGLGVQTDEKNFIIVDALQQTSVEGVFAAGSVTINTPKLIITSSAEGARAAFAAYRYLKEKG